jgi:flavin-binding protein dodecin
LPGPKSDKHWADAVKRAVHRESEGKGSPKWLDVIANRVVEEAAKGDIQAIREVGDRLDGKPTQTLAHGGAEDLPPVSGIAVQFVRPDSPADDG